MISIAENAIIGAGRSHVPYARTGWLGRRVIGYARRTRWGQRAALDWVAPAVSLPEDELADGMLPKIIVGPLSAPSGLGQAARLTASACARLGHRTAVIDVAPYFTGGEGQPFFEHERGLDIDGPAQVITFLPAPYVPVALAMIGAKRRGWHVTACLAWELPRLPVAWRPALACASDFWAPSHFSARAVREAVAQDPLLADTCIRTVPHPVAVETLSDSIPGAATGKKRVGFSFSMHAGMTRKNPLDLVDAYRRAFDGETDVVLSLRIQSPEAWPAGIAALRTATQGLSVEWADGATDRAAYLAWLGGLDVYASLHRSEGFGLTLAEAMLTGVPVVATDWSGNIDFMRGPNVFMVPATTTPVVDPQGVTPRDCGDWAAPDCAAAAELLRRAVSVGRRTRVDVPGVSVEAFASGAGFSDRTVPVRAAAGVVAP